MYSSTELCAKRLTGKRGKKWFKSCPEFFGGVFFIKDRVKVVKFMLHNSRFILKVNNTGI